MLKAKDKKQSFALFLRGYSIRQIAKKTGISRSTIERWSRIEEWVNSRESFQYESQRQAAKEMLTEDPTKLARASIILADEVVISIKAIELARQRHYSQKTISKSLKTALRNVKLYIKLFNLERSYIEQRKIVEDVEKMYLDRTKENQKKII